MTAVSAWSVVMLAGCYLVALGAVALLAPAAAARFLLGFVGSAFLHYLELVVRFIIGAAFLAHAPQMMFPAVFSAVGWMLLITTGCLCLVPWRMHHRFAQRAIPHAVRHLPWVGLASLMFGGAILAAAMRGVT